MIIGVDGSGAGIPGPGRTFNAAPDACAIVADRIRPRRVTIVVLATAALGLIDLAFTLTYMTSIGMIEANPLARLMVSIGGAGQLVRFKLFTILLSGGLLYLSRERRIAEVAAWLGLLIMLMLSAHWLDYNEQVAVSDVSTYAELIATDTRFTLIRE